MIKILVVIVCYNVNIQKLEYLEHLKDVDIFIYDNSKTAQKVNSKYYYIHDPSNPGVSRAYNEGYKKAKEIDADFMLILDHDTKFNNEILDQYKEAAEKYGEEYIYAPIIYGNDKIYSPFKEKGIRNLPMNIDDFEYKEIYTLKNQSLINSGLMIPLKVYDIIGGFSEKIKLDFSDIYFLSRYKEYREEIVLVDQKLKHSLSGDEGHHKERELSRYRYYCNGAKAYAHEIPSIKFKAHRFVFFRMLRLVVKYRSLKPVKIACDYYLGDKLV